MGKFGRFTWDKMECGFCKSVYKTQRDSRNYHYCKSCNNARHLKVIEKDVDPRTSINDATDYQRY